MSQLKANILAKLHHRVLRAPPLTSLARSPADTRFEAIKVGRLSASVPGALTSAIGQGTFDWLNASETTTGFVFPDLITFNATVPVPQTDFDNINLSALPSRFAVALSRKCADAFTLLTKQVVGWACPPPMPTPIHKSRTANAAATGGVQYQDFMSGDPSLGFNTSVFNGTPDVQLLAAWPWPS